MIELLIPCRQLGRRELPRCRGRLRRGQRRRGQRQRHPYAVVGGDGRRNAVDGGEHLLEPFGLFGRRGFLSKRTKFIDRRAQIEIESLQARNEVALDQVEATSGDQRLLMLLVVKIDVAHA